MLSTAVEAERDGVKVPTTLAEYCIQTRVPSQDSSSDLLYDDLYDDDMEEEDEEEEESEMESVGEAGGISSKDDGGTSTRCYDNQDDSGNEDSWCPERSLLPASRLPRSLRTTTVSMSVCVFTRTVGSKVFCQKHFIIY